MTEESSSLDEFEALNQGQGAHCGWQRNIAILTDAERARLDGALRSPRIQHTAIQRWLAERDIAVAKSTVARHRPTRKLPSGRREISPDGIMECLTCRTG